MATINQHFKVSRTPRTSSKNKHDAVPQAVAPITTTDQAVDDHAAQQVLLDFDMCSKYGPMSGMTRMQRWERAAAAGLDPPVMVQHLLLEKGLDSVHNQPTLMKGK